MRGLAAAAILAALFGALPAVAQEIIVGPRPQAVDDRWILDPPGITIETWASNLVAPWSLAFLPDGGVPADNPFPGSPIWSLGHRNVQGLAWDPRTGAFYNSEHGPSGEVGFGAYDEVNLVEKGANFGWPLVVGAAGQGGMHDPIAAWPEVATPPSGASFWRGDLYVAILGDGMLPRLILEHERVVGIERWFNDGDRSRLGRLRDAVRGPDGALYILTGTHDWRGDPRPGDDRILRITAAAD